MESVVHAFLILILIKFWENKQLEDIYIGIWANIMQLSAIIW